MQHRGNKGQCSMSRDSARSRVDHHVGAVVVRGAMVNMTGLEGMGL